MTQFYHNFLVVAMFIERIPVVTEMVIAGAVVVLMELLLEMDCCRCSGYLEIYFYADYHTF